MTKLNIITVGYNEELNLPKLLKSLEYIKSKTNIRHIYVDQASNDNSVNIAKEKGCEVYIHENKGYADPDKKWIVETLIQDDEWCLIFDCDEELIKELADEILHTINEGKYEVCNIKLSTSFLGIKNGTFTQPRLFKKRGIDISDEIHNYLKIKSNKITVLKNVIINNDLKMKGKEIISLINKQTKYAENEIQKFQNISNLRLKINLFWMPLLWFFGWGIMHKLFFKGIPGIIYCFYMAYYQFTIYSLIYEKRKNENSSNINSQLE